jgi:hypothetical protein
MMFSFGRDVNINWKHGVNALPEEEQTGKGSWRVVASAVHWWARGKGWEGVYSSGPDCVSKAVGRLSQPRLSSSSSS